MSSKTRFYFHGDFRETEPPTYYCARCDSFVRSLHMIRCGERASTSDAEQLRRSKRLWRQLDKSRWYRPKDVTNFYE